MIEIDGRKVGLEHEPFIVAEMSGNHNQSLDRALEIVDAAASCGAHALKIQTYTADTMTLDLAEGEFKITDPNSPWSGTSLYQLYRVAHTPWEWHEPIFARARQRGLIPFSAAFDETAVDFLESLGAPCYKVASFENTDLPLVRRMASTGKPLIISTGLATVGELEETVRAARDAGCTQLVLLKCTSSYPAPPKNTNIRTIPHLRELFGCEVGLSDHTMGAGVAVASVALGATVVEKHLTLRRSDGGVDSKFSAEPAELAMLAEATRGAWQALGKVHYGPTAAEQGSLAFRRSLYFVKALKKGEAIAANCIRSIRPGLGLPPKLGEFVIGRRVSRDVSAGTPVAWDLLA